MRILALTSSLVALAGACGQPGAPAAPPLAVTNSAAPAVQVIDVPRVATAAPTPSTSAPPPEPTTRPEDEPWPTFTRASSDGLAPARLHKSYDKDAAEMTAAMQPLFQQCYRRALREDRKTEGTARLLLEVGRGGGVDAAEIMESAGLSQRMLACCVEAALSRKFPDPGGTGEQIVVPLKFVSRD